MRSARYKTIPHANRKVPFGIARQRELMELVERRFAQAELIRIAVRCARGHAIPSLADDETIPTDAVSAETAAAPVEASIKPTAAPAESTDDTASASNEDAPVLAAPAADRDDSASTADDSADSTPDAPDTVPADAPSCGEPLRTITLIWHGKKETIEHPEVWLTIFNDVSEAGDAITRELVRRRFRDEPYWKTCDALYLSHSAYYHNVREILHYTLACAVSYGILDPRPKQPAESA